MIKPLPARITMVLSVLTVLAALVIGALVVTSVAPAPVESSTGTVKYGTTDQLTPEERELLESDTPKTAVVDAATGDIISVTVDTDG